MALCIDGPSLLGTIQSKSGTPRLECTFATTSSPIHKKYHHSLLHRKILLIFLFFSLIDPFCHTTILVKKYTSSSLQIRISSLFLICITRYCVSKNGIIDFEFCGFYNCEFSVKLLTWKLVHIGHMEQWSHQYDFSQYGLLWAAYVPPFHTPCTSEPSLGHKDRPFRWMSSLTSLVGPNFPHHCYWLLGL